VVGYALDAMDTGRRMRRLLWEGITVDWVSNQNARQGTWVQWSVINNRSIGQGQAMMFGCFGGDASMHVWCVCSSFHALSFACLPALGQPHARQSLRRTAIYSSTNPCTVFFFGAVWACVGPMKVVPFYLLSPHASCVWIERDRDREIDQQPAGRSRHAQPTVLLASSHRSNHRPKQARQAQQAWRTATPTTTTCQRSRSGRRSTPSRPRRRRR
jgi:hypothetical protein